MARPKKLAVGAWNGQAKLSLRQVLEIREDRGASQRDIAAKFGISQSQVSRIQGRRRWRKVSG